MRVRKQLEHQPREEAEQGRLTMQIEEALRQPRDQQSGFGEMIAESESGGIEPYPGEVVASVHQGEDRDHQDEEAPSGEGLDPIYHSSCHRSREV